MILANLASRLRVLEIGTGLGVSTRALASRAKSVVTVDPDPWVVAPDLPNVTLLREPPDDCSAFDLAFIDGNHCVDAVVGDIRLCSRIPKLVLHDTDMQDVQDAIRQCGLRLVEDYRTACSMARFTHARR